MKMAVKLAAISAAVVAVILVALFVVIPLASSKEAKARLGEALAGAGISEDLWSAKKVYYVPAFGHLVIEKFVIDDFVKADKITLAIKTNNKDIFAGSIGAQGFSLSLDGTDIIAKNISVNDFSVNVNTMIFSGNPVEALKKLGKIAVSGMSFRQNGKTYFTLGKFNANVDYSEGKIPLPASVTLKKLTADARQFNSLSSLRPEYRISTFEFKNSASKDAYNIDLTIDAEKLFKIKTGFRISVPLGLDEITDLASIDYSEDLKLNSLTFTYTDKSFLEHIFELMRLPGGRENAAELLNDSIMEIAELGGIDAERFAKESAGFLKKPGKLELKTNLESPVSFDDIGQNPFAIKLSLSINGGKSFITGGR